MFFFFSIRMFLIQIRNEWQYPIDQSDRNNTNLFDYRNALALFGASFRILWPSFFFKIEKINKTIWKNLSLKTNRYKLTWHFIYPHKRQTLIFRFLRKDLMHRSQLTILLRLKSLLTEFATNLPQTEFFRAKKFSYYYMFKYYRFKLLRLR